MRTWSLDETDPLCLTLSADARFGQTDYSNDQSWELGWWDHEIASLWLHTSYGRRTHSMHLFPVFTLGGESRQDPRQFDQPVSLKRAFPNYAALIFAPFKGIEVEADVYVPDSQSVYGRYTFTNLTGYPQAINLRLSAVLQPGEHANPMGFVEIQGVSTLAGQASDIYPVVMMSGGARKVPAPYPSLQVAATLPPGGTKTWVWAQVAALQMQDSFDRCRTLFQLPWEATLTRMEMGNTTMVQIETGDPELDSALWMSQKEVMRGFIGPTPHNSRPGLITRRGVDDGHSLASDGQDHSGPWGGLSTKDMYYLARQALPIAPELVKDLLRNVLRTQNSAGELDGAPGMGGQRAGYQAIPLVASLAWDTYLWTEDETFLAEVFPGLFSFFESWFTKRHDRDQDGFPEWDHAVQSGFDDRPLFNRFESWAGGMDISYAETVDLASYLYREGQSLIAIASILGQKGLTTVIQEHITCLRERINSSWSEKKTSYQHVDRESHISHGGLQLVKRRGESSTELERDLDPPARLLLRLKGDPSLAKKLKVEIVSQGARKKRRTESLTHRKFQFFWEWGTHTTSKLNYVIRKIDVIGLDDKLTLEVHIPELEREDLSLALPIWVGCMDLDQAHRLVEMTLTNSDRYWRTNGLSVIPATDKAFSTEECQIVDMHLNSLIGSGMVVAGFMSEAAALFLKLATPVIHSLKKNKKFSSNYPADLLPSQSTSGEIRGVLPLDLFFDCIGLRLISPSRLWVRPGNPFPKPVKVRWRGTELEWEGETVSIRFPDGQVVVVEGTEGQFVEQVNAGRATQ